MNPCCRETIASLLTPAQVAAALGISRMQVWRISQAMKLGVLTAGYVTMFTPEDVEAMRNR